MNIGTTVSYIIYNKLWLRDSVLGLLHRALTWIAICARRRDFGGVRTDVSPSTNLCISRATAPVQVLALGVRGSVLFRVFKFNTYVLCSDIAYNIAFGEHLSTPTMLRFITFWDLCSRSTDNKPVLIGLPKIFTPSPRTHSNIMSRVRRIRLYAVCLRPSHLFGRNAVGEHKTRVYF